MTITKLKTTMAGGLAGAILIATPMAASAHGASQGYQQMPSHGSQGQHYQINPAVYMARRDAHSTPKPVDCSARQTALNNRVSAYKAAATKQLGYLNNFNGMVQTYVSANGLTVANYDSLSAAVVTDQTNATSAVNAISAPTLNCDSNDQALYNNSVKTAVDALRTYKKDLNSLLNSVLSS